MFCTGINESVTSRHHVTALRYLYICTWQSLGATFAAQTLRNHVFSHSTHRNQRQTAGFSVFCLESTKKSWFYSGFRMQPIGINEDALVLLCFV